MSLGSAPFSRALMRCRTWEWLGQAGRGRVKARTELARHLHDRAVCADQPCHATKDALRKRSISASRPWILAQLSKTSLLELAASQGVSRRARANLTMSDGDAKLSGQPQMRKIAALDKRVAQIGRARKVDADVEEVERGRDGLAQDGGDLGALQAIRQAAASDQP